MAEVGVGGGIVDQDIQPPELRFDGGHQLLQCGALALVRGDGRGRAAGFTNGLGNRFQRRLLAAGNHHVRAVLGHQARGGFAYAARSAGNQRNAAAEVEKICGHVSSV